MPLLTWTNLPALALTQDASLKAEWDRLNATSGNLPFLSGDAVTNALQIFGRGDERLLVGKSGQRNAAMLLLTHSGKFRWQTFQPSQLPLGCWLAEPQLKLDALAHDLLVYGPLRLAMSLSITQTDPLFAPRGEDTASNRHDDYIHTAWVDITGTFDDYWAARGKNLRQNMRKQRNKLQTESIALETRVYREPVDMPGAIERYGALESKGWKAQEGTAIRPDNDQGKFYTRLLREAAAKGEATVYECLFNGKTVASNLCLRRGGTLVILKTTYDESIHNYSPAFLLNQDLTQALFEEGKIQRLEYYGGLMEWHTRWTDNRRTLYHLTSFRHSLVKRLARSLANKSSSPPEAVAASAPATV
jgi:CelD/BcsL family acetyltransferase involved in cellulose biosynthesis